MLVAAALLVGALLALFGQTYQTGADPWQLFFIWALMISPWVFISRLPVMWLLILALLNISALLYFKTFGGALEVILLPVLATKNGFLWSVFILNIVALAIWESVSEKFPWMDSRWAPRTIAVAAGVPVTWLALAHITDAERGSIVAMTVWLLWAACIYAYYRWRRQDLFMLAGLVLSAAAILITYLAEPLFKYAGSAAFLFVAILIVGASSAGTLWLRRVNAEWQA